MLLVLPTVAMQSANVELYRGAPLAAPGYWAVEDAYLDRTEANEDHGGGFTLLGGDGRTILIRFGDLQRMVGPSRRVTAATLVLAPSGGDIPKLKGVTAVDLPWGEGPVASLSRIINNLETKATDIKPKTGPARGAATWNERRAGIVAWPSPGTPGGTAIDGATGAVAERSFTISGLGPTVQNWLTRPSSNHGFALAFEGNVEFFSSQSPSGRPKLVLTTEPVAQIDVTHPDLEVASINKTDGKWVARIKNVGSAVAPPARAVWWADGKSGADIVLDKSLAPNAETTLTFAGPEPSNDLQVPSLGLSLSPAAGDADPANDRLDVFTTGKPVTLRVSPRLDAQAIVRFWNETVAQQSRFSFAPEGVKSRVRLASAEVSEDGAATLPDALRQIGKQLGLPQVTAQGSQGGRGSEDLYPGLMGYGDTRFEGTLPGKLTLPYEPYPDPATETALLEPTGLLCATDVGRLNDPSAPLPMPRATLLRVVDLVGRSLSGLEVMVEQPGATAVKMTTSPSGTLVLPNRGPDGPFGALQPNLANGTISLRATQHGITETGFIKAWRLSDAYRRSGSPAVLMDVHLDLPMLALESGSDLAKDRIVSDSTGTDPAKLAAVTDGDDATAAALPEKAGSWVEIDLGRDRTLGEIALKPGEGPFWSKYDIFVYSTGQKPEDALPWASEANSGWARRNRADGGWVAYRAPVQRVRFIRISSKTGGPASLAGFRVVPVKIQQ